MPSILNSSFIRFQVPTMDLFSRIGTAVFEPDEIHESLRKFLKCKFIRFSRELEFRPSEANRLLAILCICLTLSLARKDNEALIV